MQQVIACDSPGCTRGLIHLPGGFANPCSVCLGSGELTLARICSLLGENRSTVIKLLKPRRRMRAKTASRMLDKLLTLLATPETLVEMPPLELEDEFTECERRQIRMLV